MTKDTRKDLMYRSALYYAEKLNYSVIPIKNDKKAFVPWADYQKKKPTKKEIVDWWLLKYPGANIGIITGKASNLVIVDIDDPNIKHAMLDAIEEMAMPPACSTPRGGRHLYFSCPEEDIRNTVNIFNKVDIRGEGGYVLAPPSSNGTGKAYEWIKGRKITDVQTTELPHSIVAQYRNTTFGLEKKEKEKSLPHTPSKEKEKEISDSSIISELNNISDIDIYNCNKHATGIENPMDTNLSGGKDNALSFVDPPVAPPPILQPVTNSLHGDYKHYKYYTEGRRDEDLFHIANCLVKGGAEPEFIRSTIEHLASRCKPPFSLREANEKLLSALNRQERKTRSLASDVEEFISAQEGYFDVSDIVKDLGLTSKEEKKHLTVIMHRLKAKGTIKHHAGRAGRYRIVSTKAKVMDYMAADIDEFPLVLPYGLSEMCKLYPGNIIMVAGTKSAGKTAFMLNVVKENMHNLPIVYMNSEMGETELRIRLEMFDDIELKDWKFTPYALGADWEDMITDEKKVFIIDYLDITDELWKVGTILKGIHTKLKDGIAIIAIQRDSYKQLGRGGSFSIEKARLYVNLDYDFEERINKLKIIDCKAWRERSPRGLTKRYKLHKGSNYTMIGDWYEETAKKI